MGNLRGLGTGLTGVRLPSHCLYSDTHDQFFTKVQVEYARSMILQSSLALFGTVVKGLKE